jgi:hypothetical protein
LKKNLGKEKAVNKDEFKEALLNRIEKSNEDLDKTEDEVLSFK